MVMWRRRASERKTNIKVVHMGRHPFSMVVMQLSRSLYTVILIIVCKCNSRRCKVGERVRYL